MWVCAIKSESLSYCICCDLLAYRHIESVHHVRMSSHQIQVLIELQHIHLYTLKHTHLISHWVNRPNRPFIDQSFSFHATLIWRIQFLSFIYTFLAPFVLVSIVGKFKFNKKKIRKSRKKSRKRRTSLQFYFKKTLLYSFNSIYLTSLFALTF